MVRLPKLVRAMMKRSRSSASLLPGQRLNPIHLDQALALFKLPRDLGETAEGEPLSTNIGRFGPYVRYGKKYVSLGKDDDPYTITTERALELVAEKKIADANRIINVFEEAGISVLNGRFGPYITDGSKNVKVPKDREPKSISLEEARELIAAAPPPRRGAKKKVAKKAATTSEKRPRKRRRKRPRKRSLRKKRRPKRRRPANRK